MRNPPNTLDMRLINQRLIPISGSLGNVARESIPGELFPSTYLGRHVARDLYPQRQVAREGLDLSLGIVVDVRFSAYHTCTPPNGAINLPPGAVTKLIAYTLLGGHGQPFPPNAASANVNALTGWMANVAAAAASSYVKASVISALSLAGPLKSRLELQIQLGCGYFDALQALLRSSGIKGGGRKNKRYEY
ncbi:topless-related protein 3-like protein [Tanacetum coccineum]